MKALFLLAATALLTSCSSSRATEIDDLFRNTKSTETKLIQVDIPSNQIAEPVTLTAGGDKLLAGNYRGDPMIAVFDMSTPGREGSTQPNGKAANEMLKISSMYGANNELFLYSSMDNKVFWRKEGNLTEAKPERILHSQAQKRDLFWFKMMPVAGGRYVVVGIMDPTTKAQFALLDDSLRVTRYFDSFPVEGTPMANLSFQQQSMGMQGLMTRSPDGRWMMWTPMTGTMFRFYDFAGQKPRKIKEHILHVASFGTREDTDVGVAQDRDNEWGGDRTENRGKI